MQRIFNGSLTIIGLATLVPLASIAKNFSIGPCESKGGEERLADVICELAQDTVVNLGHKVSSAKKASDGKIVIKSLRLGSSYSLSGSLIVEESIVRSSKLKASSPDEFDQIVPRVVRAIVEGEDPKIDARVGEVSDNEREFRKKRLNSKREGYLAAGFAAVTNVAAKKTYYNLGVGGAVDWTQFRLRGGLDFGWHAGERTGSFLALSASGNFFLSDDQSAVYLGPKIGIAYVTKSNPPDSGTSIFPLIDTDSAFLLGAVLGWEFFRNYESSFAVEFSADIVMDDLGAGNPIIFGIRGIVSR